MDHNDPDETQLSIPLREQAEARLGAVPDDAIALSNLSADDIHKLIHELRVHQIELKSQNEELRWAQELLGESRDRYQELYDYAPVGYFTIGPSGLIEDVNLTASNMLGTERVKLKEQRLSRFVVAGDQDVLCLHRRRLLDGDGPQAFELRVRGGGGSFFYAQVEMALVETAEG